jgi:rRNA small subunit pseudouridine methyltransferase Nep1
VRLGEFFKDIPDYTPIVVAVGAMAKGPDSFADEYVTEKIGKLKREKSKRNFIIK